MNSFFSNNKSVILAIVALLVVNLIYFFPTLTGKVLAQDDIIGGKAKQREMREYREDTGKEALWTNAMFSGMPTFQLGVGYPNNVFTYIHLSATRILNMGSTTSIYITATLLLCFFAFLQSFKVKTWLAFTGAIMFAFSGFFIISFAAGHNLKVLVAGYSVAMIMGITMAYRGKLWMGALFTAFFAGWSIFANHFQITFYTLFIAFFIALAYFIYAIKEKEISKFIKTSLVLLVAGLIGVAPNLGNIWSTYTYSQESMRGGKSDLATKENKEGLEFDYAMSWSYSPLETMGIFVPQVMGGGAKENYEGTEVYDFLRQNLSQQGVSRNKIDQVTNQYTGSTVYWGEQSLVNGAYYAGAPLLFLFFIGIFFLKGPTRLWVILSSLLSLFMAWGYHFESFNRIMYDHFPLVNKFRVPSMSLVILFMLLPFVGMLGIDRFVKSDMNLAQKKSLLLRALYLSAGPVLFIALLGPSFFDFAGVRDATLQQQGFDMAMLEDTRQNLMRNSAFKSLLLITLSFGLLWFYNTGKIKYSYLAGGLAILLIGDLMYFDRDQLGSEEFITDRNYANLYSQPSAADQQIMQNEKDEHYRVWNATTSLTSDSYTSYFHHSIGGYHGAKLQRYQDLIDRQLSKQNMAAFNMLNTKWVIQSNRQGQGGEVALQNPGALGNAWFVDSVKIVGTADEEMDALTELNPAKTAIVHNEFKDFVQTINPSSPANRIQLTDYSPNHLTYSANVSGASSLAVFSEIYYKPEQQAWQAYIDGQAVDHFRANYLLRALNIPPGKHTVEFRFTPKTYVMGEKIDLTASIVLVLGIGLILFFTNRSSKKMRDTAES